MRKLALAAAMALALAGPAEADVIVGLGINPTSGAGAFANTNPGTGGGGSGLFEDRYTFTLAGAQVLTIASVTNVFASLNQFIGAFTGSVVFEGANNAIGGGDDVTVIGPVAAVACSVPDCQGFAGSQILGGGDYHLLITGNAAIDAGYGGNLSTFAVPGPIAGAGLPIILGCLALLGLGRLRRRVV